MNKVTSFKCVIQRITFIGFMLCASMTYIWSQNNESWWEIAEPLEKESTDRQNMLLHPSDTLNTVLIINPTEHYSNAQYRMVNLVKKMINIDQYHSIYIDLPAFEAMLLDDYIKDKFWMPIDSLFRYNGAAIRARWFFDETNARSLLMWLRNYNSTHERKISIRGLDYTCRDFAVLPLIHIYPKLDDVVKPLIQLHWDFEGNQKKALDSILAKLKAKQKAITSNTYDDYNVFVHYIESYDTETRINQQKYDSLLIHNMLYLKQLYPQDSRNIVMLNLISLRNEPNEITFRTRMADVFREEEYFIYNIIDDIVR